MFAKVAAARRLAVGVLLLAVCAPSTQAPAPSLDAYEEEEARIAGDRDARIAMAMLFGGPLTFTIYRGPSAAIAPDVDGPQVVRTT